MLDEARCERILTAMKSMDVEIRLKAINEAKVANVECFKDEMSDKEWAYAAYFLESQYNLVREMLRVKQIRVKQDTGTPNTPAVKTATGKAKAAPRKKSKPEPIDTKALMAEMMQFMKSQTNTGENKNG